MSTEKKYQVLEEMNESIHELMKSYMERHSKVLPVRCDIRYPQDYEGRRDNKDISTLMSRVSQTCRRKSLDPAYVWVREQNESESPHFHVLILLNGHKSQNPYGVFNTVEKHWRNIIGSKQEGLIHHCNTNPDGSYRQNGELMHRAEGIPEHVERQVSYMAKPSSKGEPKDGLRDYGMSRIKKR